MVQRRKIFLLSLIMLLFAAAANGCSASGATPDTTDMASLDSMPAEIQDAPTTVRKAYQFAIANPDILTGIPCYCGCGAMGHTSNYACYVSGVDEKGSILFDNHALGCSICVDITLDAMRLMQQGKTVAEIREYVDQTYAQFGSSNMP